MSAFTSQSGTIIAAFQPIVSCGENTVAYYEVLARWQDENGRLHNPDNFIPAIEASKWVTDFDCAMLKLTCRELRSSQHSLSVNLSARTITEPLRMRHVLQILKKNRHTKGRLMLEVTENQPLTYDRFSDIRGSMTELQKLGVSVAFDDFGAGCFLSVGAILGLQPRLIKTAIKMLENPLQMEELMVIARQQNIQIVVEGIETQQQAEHYTAMGANYLQGYLFGEPMTETEWRERRLQKGELPLPHPERRQQFATTKFDVSEIFTPDVA